MGKRLFSQATIPERIEAAECIRNTGARESRRGPLHCGAARPLIPREAQRSPER